MHRATLPTLLLALLASSAPASAAASMKPGLWETSIKNDATKAMPKLPPEQVEQMKKMGLNLPMVQDGAMVLKHCVTKEMAERDQIPQSADAQGCVTKNLQKSASGFSVDLVCDTPYMKGTGATKGRFTGDTTYTMTSDFKGTVGGQPSNTHTEVNGKWLGADCGTVKPMALPTK